VLDNIANFKSTWYKIPCVLLILSPLIAPQYNQGYDSYIQNLFISFTFVGCVCSVIWFLQVKKVLPRVVIGVIASCYVIFSVLIIGGFIRGSIQI